MPGTETMGLFETIATQTALASQGQQPTGPEATQPALATSAPETNPTAKPTKVPPTPKPTKVPATAAPTQPPVVVPAATAGIPATYTMQQGEFPYCVARRFNVNPNDLLSINGLTTATTTYAGLELKIPQNGKTFPAARSIHQHPTSYTVKANDTIYSIACYFGDVDPLLMAQVNNLQKPYTLTTGATLQVP